MRVAGRLVRFPVLSRLGLVVVMVCLVGSVGAFAPGDLDSSFGSGGFTYSDLGAATGDKAFAVAIQPDGMIVVAGSSNNGVDEDFAVARYDSGGDLDSTFGSGGRVITPIGGGDDIASSVALQADNKIVVTGSSFNGVATDIAVLRYTITGTLDTTFGSNGIVTETITIGDDVANAVAIQADGMIVLAGSAGQDFAVLRYDSDGILDTTFGVAGIVTTDFYVSNDSAQAIAIQPGDGKLVVAGFADSQRSDEFAVARYDTDGSLDTGGFGSPKGWVTTDFATDSIDQAFSVAIQADGKIVLAGFVNEGGGGSDDFAAARYESNGNLDATFSGDGMVVTPIGAHDDQAYGVAVQPTGKIVLAGWSDNKAPSKQDLSLARYTITGTLDTTFGVTGTVSTDLGTINVGSYSEDYAYGLAIQADNKIVVAGYTDYPAGNNNFTVVRYESPNNTPTVSDTVKTGTDEDTDVLFTADDFATHFADVDEDALAGIQIGSLPANGSLMLDGVAVTQDQEIPSVDLSLLSFNPDQDWYGDTSFAWNGSDGIEYAAVGATVYINLAPVNDPPTISDIPDQTAIINGAAGPITFTIGDVDNAPSSLLLLGSSSNQALLPDGNIVFGGSGEERTVTLMPSRNITGTTSVTIIVLDLDLAANEDSLVLTVDGVLQFIPLVLK